MAEATSLSNAIKKVKNNICRHGVYAPYVRFTVLGSAKYGDVSFTTYDDGLRNNICCITQFENVKNGSGQANSFSLTISFAPSKNGLMYNNSNVLDYSNVNLIDEILNINKKPGAQTKCQIQYGYSYPMSLLTPVYEGVILDYSVEVSNGILNYTLTGYSGLSIEFKDSKVTIGGDLYKALVDSPISMLVADTTKEYLTKAITQKPTDTIQYIYDTYIKDNTDYILEWAPDTKGTDKEIELPIVQSVSVVSYMKTLLDLAEYSGDNEDTEIESRSQYCMIISDVPNKDGKKIIRIERYDPVAKQDKKYSADTIRFSWMGSSKEDFTDYSSNAMVIDFKANFKGSVTMAYDYSSMAEQVTRMGIDSSGKTIETVGTNIPVTGSNTDNDNTANLNLWVSRLQYAYGATLVLVGIPYEIKILENIYVAPMILGQEHHTGGLYKITKITDLIDGSGFTTTLEIFKNKGEDSATRAAKKKRAEIQSQIDKTLSKSYNPINGPGDERILKEQREQINLLNEAIGDGGVD